MGRVVLMGHYSQTRLDVTAPPIQPARHVRAIRALAERDTQERAAAEDRDTREKLLLTVLLEGILGERVMPNDIESTRRGPRITLPNGPRFGVHWCGPEGLYVYPACRLCRAPAPEDSAHWRIRELADLALALDAGFTCDTCRQKGARR